MKPDIDLTRFGIRSDKLKGTVTSSKLTGNRLLLLFGERHTIRAGIKANLLNAVHLIDSGWISCVGVEGWKDPADPVPCEKIAELFTSLKTQHGNDEGAIIEGIMQAYQPNNYVFWKTLTLLRPALPIRSVENPAIFQAAGHVSRSALQERISEIRSFLEKHPDLPFSQTPIVPLADPSCAEIKKQTIIECKSATQGMEEFAENPLNYQRDEAFITNMLHLWDESGPDKAAILNAGVSHQYRIARQLQTNSAFRDEYSYILIEQP